MSGRNIVLLVVMGSLLPGCGSKKKGRTEAADKTSIEVPAFNRDSAYFFVKKQVDFGPRVPNTDAHKKAGDYFVEVFKRYGAEVTVQAFNTPAYDGQLLFLKNIIASYATERKKRIVLAAHWDTRPFADKDTVNAMAPFDGANDGASGVGVLLEVARLLGQGRLPRVGVDILLFDGEDWGEPRGEAVSPPPSEWDSWWCLGSQYWSRNKHKAGYSAYYGILLDMVGAKGAQFFREGTSQEYAPKIVRKVWDTALRLGYSNYFVKRDAGPITDDHLYMNKWGKIPTINIVHYQPGVGYFGDYHHSQRDNMDLISREALEAVGNTIVHTLYYENE